MMKLGVVIEILVCLLYGIATYSFFYGKQSK